ncbi:MAG: hypothetical protein HYV42_05360 [Candidatus Magasanikbacteria bacterium]|nr:hypothetical protein [Candidatus Magasanikbacteria bacterium]
MVIEITPHQPLSEKDRPRPALLPYPDPGPKARRTLLLAVAITGGAIVILAVWSLRAEMGRLKSRPGSERVLWEKTRTEWQKIFR